MCKCVIAEYCSVTAEKGMYEIWRKSVRRKWIENRSEDLTEVTEPADELN